MLGKAGLRQRRPADGSSGCRRLAPARSLDRGTVLKLHPITPVIGWCGAGMKGSEDFHTAAYGHVMTQLPCFISLEISKWLDLRETPPYRVSV